MTPSPIPETSPVSSQDLPTLGRVVSPSQEESLSEVVVPSPLPRREKRRVRFTLPEDTSVPTREKTRTPEVSEQEYVVDKLVDVWEALDGRSRVYRVRWLGYNPDEDTWEAEENLPKHFIRRYWKSKRIATQQGI